MSEDEARAAGPLRVIVATDGSDASLMAAHEAAGLIPADAELSLVIVIDEVEDPMADAGGFEGPTITEREAQEEYRTSMVAAEGALARSATSFGPRPIRQRIVERSDESIGARLCSLAAEEHAAMIVVGSHGHGALADVLLGSVGNYVVHHSPCPVLVIRRRESAPTR
jgi:nucleotide-binding universal stress UspA family protein